jgi:SAM-dependent methyltransferase
MSLEVLQDKLQIGKARQELIDKGASFITPPDSRLRALMRSLGLVRGTVVGDMLKSWDVLATINFLERNLGKNEPILDIGCYASEVIVALRQLGFSNLTGADLDPKLTQMPHQESIRYERCNFMHTPFADASFQAITSISVIEHDFDGQSLLQEMSRLLRPGGYFIASFDYWPEKIDTGGTRFFGMDWKIFSKEEISRFVTEAAGYGLFPVGELKYSGKEKPIDCAGKQYTFGWLVLKKAA